jgi:hypothetical protein
LFTKPDSTPSLIPAVFGVFYLCFGNFPQKLFSLTVPYFFITGISGHFFEYTMSTICRLWIPVVQDDNQNQMVAQLTGSPNLALVTCAKTEKNFCTPNPFSVPVISRKFTLRRILLLILDLFPEHNYFSKVK